MHNHKEFRQLANLNIFLTSLCALVCLVLLACEQVDRMKAEDKPLVQVDMPWPVDDCIFHGMAWGVTDCPEVVREWRYGPQ